MTTGPNHPAHQPNQGGKGRRRRRGRRPQQGAPNQQQGGENQNHQASASPSRPRGPERQQRRSNRNPKQQSQQRNGNQRANPRVPDAGIYSAPMDHSYRSRQENQPQRRGYAEPQAEMPTNGATKSIYAFVDDLFFLAKIQETGRKLGVKVEFVKPEKEVLDKIVALEEKPALIIFDLNSLTSKPLQVIPKLKSKLKKATSIIGFVSHVQGELKVKAQEAGCDMVLPRSAFSQNLPQLLRRHATDTTSQDEE